MVTLGLFSRSRGAVLSALLLHPERAWHLRELARHLGLPPSSLQAELAHLTGQGILRRWRDGRRVLHRADVECPWFPELQGLVAKTCGVAEVLREALAPLGPRIQAAFVHGSMAKGTADASSDVDLFVVGDVTRTDLARVLPPVAVRLGRPVNPTLLSPAEFRRKRRRNAFVRTVLTEPRLGVLGDLHALGTARAGRTRREEGSRS
jgi:predicted nucleotidyltransferase